MHVLMSIFRRHEKTLQSQNRTFAVEGLLKYSAMASGSPQTSDALTFYVSSAISVLYAKICIHSQPDAWRLPISVCACKARQCHSGLSPICPLLITITSNKTKVNKIHTPQHCLDLVTIQRNSPNTVTTVKPKTQSNSYIAPVRINTI